MKQLSAIVIMLLSLVGCGNRNAKNSAESAAASNPDAAVEVYVFHAAQRCATCKAM